MFATLNIQTTICEQSPITIQIPKKVSSKKIALPKTISFFYDTRFYPYVLSWLQKRSINIPAQDVSDYINRLYTYLYLFTLKNKVDSIDAYQISTIEDYVHSILDYSLQIQNGFLTNKMYLDTDMIRMFTGQLKVIS